MSHQNVARLARDLSTKRFVTIQEDPSDGRVKRIQATDRSRAYWARRDPEDLALVRDLFAPIPRDDLRQLVALLHQVKTSVDSRYQAVRHGL